MCVLILPPYVGWLHQNGCTTMAIYTTGHGCNRVKKRSCAGAGVGRYNMSLQLLGVGSLTLHLPVKFPSSEVY